MSFEMYTIFHNFVIIFSPVLADFEAAQTGNALTPIISRDFMTKLSTHFNILSFQQSNILIF